MPRWTLVLSVLGLDGYALPYTPTFYKVGEWFLGCLILLYVLFPLLLRLQKNRAWAAALAVWWVVWPQLCPSRLDPGHTVLGTLPVFALGIAFGRLLKTHAEEKTFAAGVALLFGGAALLALALRLSARCAVLLAAAAVFWLCIPLGSLLRGAAVRAAAALAKNCYGTFLVHHVLLTLVWVPVMRSHRLFPEGWLAVYLAAAFLLGTLLRRCAAPLTKWMNRHL